MKRICACMLALLLCLTSLGVCAQAADVTLDITFLPITEDGFVADTMDGVDALYDLGGGPLCSELIERYYAQVYGVDVQLGGAPVVTGGTGHFEETDVPQHGDILYASAEARGSCAHYALCRSVDESAGTVTLFEQNWSWNGQAGIDRVIPLDGCYTYYTLVGGEKQPEHAPEEDAEAPDAGSWYDEDRFDPTSLGTPSGWAEGYVELASELGILAGLTSDYRSAITRGEFAQMVVDACEALTGEYTGRGAVSERAEALGLMFGDGNGNFRLADTLTRQEAAVICTRLMTRLGSAPEAQTAELSVYSDRAQIADWAKSGVSVMTQLGLMSGTGTGFAPTLTITTEQAITLLVRVYESMLWF